MDTKIIELRKRILPVLLYCQANKGDLSLFNEWKAKADAGKKLFYTYYSGLFCRVLYLMDKGVVFRHFYRDCELLLNKYNWFDLQTKDVELYKSTDPNNCEVPDAISFIEGLDDVAWKVSSFGCDNDAICISGNSNWTFADVRGSVKL